MRFAIGTCAKIDQVHLVKQAEDLGVTHFGVGEGPLLFSDPYQFLALAAAQTSSIKLGTWVTNPMTRIAPVTANSIATLNSLAPGRTFLGMGTANNAMRSMGSRVATMSELDNTLSVIGDMLKGRRTKCEILGQETEVEFLDADGHWYNFSDPVEMWVSAGGPKALAIAAKYADSVTYILGPDPSMVRLVRQELDKAVAKAGRPPGSVKLLALTWFYLLRPGQTWENAVEDGFGSAPVTSCLMNAPFLNAHASEFDPRMVESANEAADAYLQLSPGEDEKPHYLETWAKYLRGLDPVHRPIITKELCDYWCIYGNPEEIQQKAQVMLDAGADMLGVYLSNPFTAERDVADIGATVLNGA